MSDELDQVHDCNCAAYTWESRGEELDPARCSCGWPARLRTYEFQLLMWEDECLIAITDGYPLPTTALLGLPPWRAVLLARVADRAGIGLEAGTLDQLVAEASKVGGAGRLGKWWEREQS